MSIRKNRIIMFYMSIALFFMFLNGSLFITFAQQPAKQIKLKFATEFPSIHHMVRNLIIPWAKEVEKRTEGRIKITVFPDQQLGKFSEMYDDLLKGISDIAFIVPVGITGRFPLESVFHLPTLIPGYVWDPTCIEIRNIVFEKYLIPMYFKDVKILWTGRFALNNLLMVSKPVRRIEDLKGKIIGFPSGKTPPLVIRALGGTPERIFPPEIYTSLEKKIIDGVLFPIDSLRGFKLAEVVKYVTKIDFGSASHFVAMRLPAWNSLSPPDQKIIMDLIPWAIEAQSKTYKNDAELAIETGRKAGIEFIELLPEERKRWMEALKSVEEQWAKEMDDMGLPGTKLYQEILQLLKR